MKDEDSADATGRQDFQRENTTQTDTRGHQ